MTLATEWKFCSKCFVSFSCENTHKVWYKIYEIDKLMIIDLLTLPQSHQFDPRVRMLLAFYSARHPRRFDVPHGHDWKKKLTPWAPQVPLNPTFGAWIKILSDMVCIFHLWEHTQSLYKNLWNWHCNRNLMIFDLWPHPKVTNLTLEWKFYLHSVLFVILVDLICHMTMFEKNKFLTTWAPPASRGARDSKIGKRWPESSRILDHILC